MKMTATEATASCHGSFRECFSNSSNDCPDSPGASSAPSLVPGTLDAVFATCADLRLTCPSEELIALHRQRHPSSAIFGLARLNGPLQTIPFVGLAASPRRCCWRRAPFARVSVGEHGRRRDRNKFARGVANQIVGNDMPTAQCQLSDRT